MCAKRFALAEVCNSPSASVVSNILTVPQSLSDSSPLFLLSSSVANRITIDILGAGEDLVPEPADEAEEARQGEPASQHRKRKRRQRDLTTRHEREFARRVVSRSDGTAAASRRQPLATHDCSPASSFCHHRH